MAKQPTKAATAATPVPATPVAATPVPAAPAPAAPAYWCMAPKAPRQGNTKKASAKGLGRQWHATATASPNSRIATHSALVALAAANGGRFTQTQAMQVISQTYSGSAANRWRAWAAPGGYIVPHQPGA